MNRLRHLVFLMVVALACSISAFSQEIVEETDVRGDIALKLDKIFDEVMYTDSLFCVRMNDVWEFADENGNVLSGMHMTNAKEENNFITATIQGREYNFSNAFHYGKILVNRYDYYAYMDTGGNLLTPFVYEYNGVKITWQDEDEIAKIISTNDLIIDTYREVRNGNYASVKKMQDATAKELEIVNKSYIDSLVVALCVTLDKSPRSASREMAENCFLEVFPRCGNEASDMMVNYFEHHASNKERKMSFLKMLADDYGISKCCVALGNMYYTGKDCQKDTEKAISYYHKAVYLAKPGENIDAAREKLTEIWEQSDSISNLLGQLYTEYDYVQVALPYIILNKDFQTMVVDTLNQVKLSLGEYEVHQLYDDHFIIKDSEGLKIVSVGGKPVIKGVFDDIFLIGEMERYQILVGKNGMWGIYEPNGTAVTEMIFSDYSPGSTLASPTLTIDDRTYDIHAIYQEGLMVVEKDGKYGCIDTKGKEVVPTIYDQINKFENGRAIVIADEKEGCIDHTGKELIPCIYDEIEGFHNGKAIVKVDDKYGIVDSYGMILYPCKYDNIEVDEEEGVFRIYEEIIVEY